MFVKAKGQILTSEGYEIGHSEMEKKEKETQRIISNVDLVTMDITIPRMDGISALEQCRL